MYTFHEDPAHAWLAVPMTEILALGIADDISTYSYMSYDGQTAYLEEDCDLSLFMRTKGLPLDAPTGWREEYSDGESPIRAFPHYVAPELRYHFVRLNRKLRYDDAREVRAGETLTVTGMPVLCQHGLHASSFAAHALRYAPGPVVCRVALFGEVVHGGDKSAGTVRACYAMADATDELRQFARECALDVADYWDAPDTVRDFLCTGNGAHDAYCDSVSAADICPDNVVAAAIDSATYAATAALDIGSATDAAAARSAALHFITAGLNTGDAHLARQEQNVRLTELLEQALSR